MTRRRAIRRINSGYVPGAAHDKSLTYVTRTIGNALSVATWPRKRDHRDHRGYKNDWGILVDINLVLMIHLATMGTRNLLSGRQCWTWTFASHPMSVGIAIVCIATQKFIFFPEQDNVSFWGLASLRCSKDVNPTFVHRMGNEIHGVG